MSRIGSTTESVRVADPSGPQQKRTSFLLQLLPFVVFGAFVGYAFLAPATYHAKAEVLLKPAGSAIPVLPSPGQAAQLLRSAALDTTGVERVAAQFGRTASDREAVRQLLEPAFSIEPAGERVFDVNVRDSRPERAQQVCNTLARRAAERATQVLLENDGLSARQALDTARKQRSAEIAAFVAAHPELSASALPVSSASVKEREVRLANLRAERDRLVSRIAQVEAAIAEGSDNPYGEGISRVDPSQLKRRLEEIDLTLSRAKTAEAKPAPPKIAPEVEKEWQRLQEPITQAGMEAARPPPFTAHLAEATLPSFPEVPNIRLLVLLGALLAVLSALVIRLLLKNQKVRATAGMPAQSDEGSWRPRSDHPPGIGSDRPPGFGSDRPPNMGSDRPPGFGSDRPPGTGSDRPSKPSDRPLTAGGSEPPRVEFGSDRPTAATTSDAPIVGRPMTSVGADRPASPGVDAERPVTQPMNERPLAAQPITSVGGERRPSPAPVPAPAAAPAKDARISRTPHPGSTLSGFAPVPIMPAPIRTPAPFLAPPEPVIEASYDPLAVASPPPGGVEPYQQTPSARGSIVTPTIPPPPPRADSDELPVVHAEVVSKDEGPKDSERKEHENLQRKNPTLAGPFSPTPEIPTEESWRANRPGRRRTQILGSPIPPTARASRPPATTPPPVTDSVPPQGTGYSYVSTPVPAAPVAQPRHTPPYYEAPPSKRPAERKSVRPSMPVEKPGAEVRPTDPRPADPRAPHTQPPRPADGGYLSTPVPQGSRGSSPTASPRAKITAHPVHSGWVPDPSLHYQARRPISDELYPMAVDGCFVVGVSAVPDWGAHKSRVAAEIAFALAEARHPRVLLLEADFQWPSVHRVLGIEMPPSAGFSRQIRMRARGGPREWTVVECAPTLHVMAEGVMRSPGLILSNHFEDAVRSFRNYYDFIVIDGPIASAEVDCRALDSVIDGLVLVTPAAGSPWLAQALGVFTEKRYSRVLGVS